MLTSLGLADCVRAVRFPVWPQRRIGVAFLEISARRSDFAFVAAAAVPCLAFAQDSEPAIGTSGEMSDGSAGLVRGSRRPAGEGQ